MTISRTDVRHMYTSSVELPFRFPPHRLDLLQHLLVGQQALPALSLLRKFAPRRRHWLHLKDLNVSTMITSKESKMHARIQSHIANHSRAFFMTCQMVLTKSADYAGSANRSVNDLSSTSHYRQCIVDGLPHIPCCGHTILLVFHHAVLKYSCDPMHPMIVGKLLS